MVWRLDLDGTALVPPRSMPRARAELSRISDGPQWDLFDSKIRLSKRSFRRDISGARFEFEVDGNSKSDEMCEKVEDVGVTMHRRATSTDWSAGQGQHMRRRSSDNYIAAAAA